MNRPDREFAEIGRICFRLRGALPVPPSEDLRSRRLLRIDESISDLRIAWERYEVDCDNFSANLEQISGVAKWNVGGPAPVPLASVQRTAVQEFTWLGPMIGFDIRCVYIFLRITFDTLMMFSKAVSRRLHHDVQVAFEEDIGWFRSHVKIYRNLFVEHPASPTPLSGISWSPTLGAQIGGFKITPSKEDRAWLDMVAAQLGHGFPAEGDRYNMQRYEWLCQNLHCVPEEHKERAEKLVAKVGMDSGNIEAITRRSLVAVTKCLYFCAGWLPACSP